MRVPLPLLRLGSTLSRHTVSITRCRWCWPVLGVGDGCPFVTATVVTLIVVVVVRRCTGLRTAVLLLLLLLLLLLARLIRRNGSLRRGRSRRLRSSSGLSERALLSVVLRPLPLLLMIIVIVVPAAIGMRCLRLRCGLMTGHLRRSRVGLVGGRSGHGRLIGIRRPLLGRIKPGTW